MNLERISAVTLKVSDMARSVRFYHNLLGLELLYGGESAYFSSLRTADAKDVILNLEQDRPSDGWGRLIFHVKDVDQIWSHLQANGLSPAPPRNGEWGERYFHLRDPDGHELSFARPLV